MSGAWTTFQVSHRSSNPGLMETTARWDAIVKDPPPGSTVQLDYWKRGRVWVYSAVNTLTGGLLQTSVGRFFVAMSPLGLLKPQINEQSETFKNGAMAGQVASIILTVVFPCGPVAMALTAARVAGGAAQAVDAAVAGRYAEAGKYVFGALASAALGKLPGSLGNVAGKMLGSTAGAIVSTGVKTALQAYGVGQRAAGAIDRIGNGDVLGGVLDLAQTAADVYASTRSCFTAEMLLDTERGKVRADQIEEGDLLWSADEFDPSAPAQLKVVEARFTRVAPIWVIDVANQIVRTTAEHPFYVEERGWTPTAELRPGDCLRTRAGTYVTLEEVADSGAVETVYNWRIADHHTSGLR